MDEFGAPHSLTRYVKGHKAKDIKAKLAPLTPDQLPSVDQAKKLQRQRQRAEGERQGEKDRGHAEERRRKAQDALSANHALRRTDLLKAEQELLTRQQIEKLELHAAQLGQSRGLVFRLRNVVADLIGRTPGLRSVLSHIQKLTHLDPKERQESERFALERRHGREKKDFERQKRAASRLETRETQSMDKALRREQRLTRELDGKVQHDFTEAARDHVLKASRGTEDVDVTVAFNDAAEFTEGADRAGDDDRAPSWKERIEETRRGYRPRHSRGYGYRRDSE